MREFADELRLERGLNLTLRVWRQSGPDDNGRFETYDLKAINEDLDLTESMDAAVNSLRIVLAADESIRTKRAVEL